MSERIDHAAKAQGLLNLLPASFHEDEVIALAQVHATFALVEQQRIANLIALGQFRVGPNELPPFRHLVMRPVNAYDVEPTTDIAAALGIGDNDE